MNYIREINAFYDRLDFVSLSPAAMTLWHTLMHMNNKIRWKESFSVSMKVLCTKANLPESTFKRARRELADKDFIRFASRGNRAPVYQMISQVVDGHVNNQEAAEDTGQTSSEISSHSQTAACEEMNRHDHQADKQQNLGMDQQMSRQTVPLIKQNNNEKQTIQINHDHHLPVYDFFRNNFGKLTPVIQQEIGLFLSQVDGDLVLHGLKRAMEYDKPHWQYAKKIIQNWQEKRIKSIDQLKERRTKHATAPSRRQLEPEWIAHPTYGIDQTVQDKTIDAAREKQELIQFIDEFAPNGSRYQSHSF